MQDLEILNSLAKENVPLINNHLPVGVDLAKYTIEAFSYNGDLYAAPRSIESLVVYYNKALLEYPYDEHLKVAADLKFNVEALIKHNCSYQSIDVVIARYEFGGISATKNHVEESRRLFEELFGERCEEASISGGVTEGE